MYKYFFFQFDDDNKFDVEGAIAMLPDEMKDTILGSVIKECGASSTGSCQSMFELNKCIYKGAPDLYFLA
ncbi:unnamed protein product [Acanthoscelides obtectus]|uniref:Uncharacterized protein n=1 Tax=Acanthoscelides obtectus TaxID=200917 RepID=A0A9P0M8F4_ACAOB|nr:unnamed protein product [Acanthoscelides obtectus]CAK1626027.1 hypothetical protein AOBTE_LOCUS3555 [Acanthoscelides obtectus]